MKQHFLFSTLLILCSIPSLAQQKYITLGSGGGFAGTVTVYKITDDGQVLKGKGLGNIKYTEQGKLKKSLARKCIKAVAKQTGNTPGFDHPGNLYFFITYQEDMHELKVTWGDADHHVKQGIQDLYQELNARMKSVDFTPIP